MTNRGQDSEESFTREVDFYLLSGDNKHKCEVKLMGRGNPKSADAVIARDSKVFVADKLSETNKQQLTSLDVEWVQLRDENGFQRFATVLDSFGIPHGTLPANMNKVLGEIFKKILV